LADHRLAKSSRSSICATVVVRTSLSKSVKAMSSHSPLRRTSRRSGSGSRIFKAWSWKVAALASISAAESIGRRLERPDGSPTRAV
jgi:hypothetical protein